MSRNYGRKPALIANKGMANLRRFILKKKNNDFEIPAGINELWIGLHQEEFTNAWGWLDGSPTDYAKWSEDFPNSEDDIVYIDAQTDRVWRTTYTR